MKKLYLILAVMACCFSVFAQRNTGSPIVNPDKTITFNFKAPQAESVKLSGNFISATDMQREEDGNWTITLGPMRPDIYSYCFEVDGVQVMDPQNPDWCPNETFKSSMVTVYSDKPQYHELQSVPHGKVDYVNYYSNTLGLHGKAVVYTPPTYDSNPDKAYPVFYLISGTTDTEEVYFKVGKVNFILDNLIAEGKAKEMIVVLPYGNPSAYYPAGTDTFSMGDLFAKDLKNDLMPFIESNYRTINDSDHRAIGGFSRGGNQGLSFGLNNLDKFSYLCSYSSFTSTDFDEIYNNPKKTNKKINLFWLGVGTDDFLFAGAESYMKFLDRKGIRNVQVLTTDKYGHSWVNARYFLCETLPLLFNKEASAKVMSTTKALSIKEAKAAAKKEVKAAPADPRNGRRYFSPGVVSPQYNKDGSVTFRVKAPGADKVELECQMLDGNREMVKGEDGVWTYTATTDTPDIYPYAFIVDGIKIADPNNVNIFPNEGFKSSLVDVRGSKPGFQDMQNVPHGKVSYVYYNSKTFGFDRPMCVYTPAGYDKSSSEKYPVLYLIHGMSDTYETWFHAGNTNIILDNLIAQGLAKKMIVVMPYANPYPELIRRGLADVYNPMDTEKINKEIIESVMPYIEANYNVKSDADSRAIAGFSLGGRQSLACGLGNPDLFHYVGAFAPAIFGNEANGNFDNGVYAAPARLNGDLKLLWLSCGTSDFLYQAAQSLDKSLTEKGIKHTTFYPGGGHTWMNCRDYLTEIAQLLFK